MAENLIMTREPKTKVSGLTYNNIVEDVYNLIKDNPNLNENISDYTSADSVRMLTEMFAWITDQLSQRMDLVANELYLDTAENKENLIKMLKIIGFELDFPECARAEFDINITNYDSGSENELMLSSGVLRGNKIQLTDSSFKKVNHALTNKTFELIVYDSAENKYEYFTEVFIKVKEANKGKLMYEGETRSLPFRVNTKGYFVKTINEPVIKNSIRIFYTNLVNGEPIEIKQVDNFFGPETVYSDTPVYRVSNLGGGRTEIIFPNFEDVEDKNLLNIGDEMTILYRVGGGRDGNIDIGSLIYKQEIWLNGGVRRGYIDIRNTSKGISGINEENIEDIRRKSPQKIKNRLSAVTSSDYEEILLSHDPTIRNIKVYGENNIPKGSNIIGTYGFSRNPLDVWLFMIKENTKFSHDIPNVTDYINDISFQTLDLNERMNEKYQVNKASMNFLIEREEDELIANDDLTSDIPYYYEFNLPIDFIEEMEEAKLFEEAPTIANFAIATTIEPFSDKENIESDNVRYLLNNPYYLDGVDKFPTKVSPFTSVGDIQAIYEEVDILLSNTIGQNRTFSGNIRFGDVDISFADTLIGDLADELNMRMNMSLNGNYPTVILYDNIETEDRDNPSEVSGDIDLEITYQGSTDIYSFTATNNKWSDLPSLIEEALNEDGEALSETFSCALIDKTYDDSDCLMLVLYTEETSISRFTVTIIVDSVAGDTKISSAIVKKTDEDKIIDSFKEYIVYSFGELILLGGGLENILEFEQTDLLMELFGLSSGDFSNEILKLGKKRSLEFDNGVMRYGVNSSFVKIPEEIYVTGIWGKTYEIVLGKYYENIVTNNKLNADDRIKNLLKRGPIKSLYSTVLKTPAVGETDTSEIDAYNSSYEIKITRRKTFDKTYFQIGEEDASAEVTMIPQSVITEHGSYLLLKVDGKNFARNGEVVESGTDVSVEFDIETDLGSFTVKEYAYVNKGYVRFDLSPFSGSPTATLLSAIVNVFGDSDNKLSIYPRDSKLVLRTISNYYNSSLSFGETSSELLRFLFGLLEGEKVVYSNSSYVPLKKADYLKFSLTDRGFAVNSDIVFETGGTEYTVNTGNSLAIFLSNIQKKAGLSSLISVRDKEIFLVSREKGSYFTVKMLEDDIDKIETMKSMFYDTKDLEVVDMGVEGYSITLRKEINGDYYINKTSKGFTLVPLEFGNFPLGDLYFHMLEDYRHDHIFGDDDSRDYTDEYKWNSIVENKKMLCVSHVFRQPKFIPFSAIVSAKISKNVAFRKEKSYSDLIYNHLLGKYNAYSPTLGETIYQSSIRDVVLEIPGVMEVSIEYLGFRPNDLSTTQSSLGTKFNEKLIIASKKEKEIVKEGLVTREPEQGLFIKVEYK